MSKLGVITLVSLLLLAVAVGCTVSSDQAAIDKAVSATLAAAQPPTAAATATSTPEPLPTETPTPQPVGKAPTPKNSEVDTSVEDAAAATVKAMEIADAVDATVEAMASQATETPTSEPTANPLPIITPAPVPTPFPVTPTPNPTSVPDPTAVPTPTSLPTATMVPSPTPTPIPTAIPFPAPTVTPIPTSTIAPTPTAEPVVQSYSGSGDSVIRSVKIVSGVLVVQAQHRGSSNFQVSMIGPDSSELSFNEIGNFAGAVAHPVSKGSLFGLEPGTVLIEVTADGSWTIDLTQESPSGGQSPPIDWKSRGQNVVRWLRFPPGNFVLSANHVGASNFQVSLLKSDGTHTELAVNEIGNYSGDNLLKVSAGNIFGMEPGLYALVVNADGEWSISVR